MSSIGLRAVIVCQGTRLAYEKALRSRLESKQAYLYIKHLVLVESQFGNLKFVRHGSDQHRKYVQLAQLTVQSDRHGFVNQQVNLRNIINRCLKSPCGITSKCMPLVDL